MQQLWTPEMDFVMAGDRRAKDKKGAAPLVRSPKQQRAVEKQREKQTLAAAERARAVRLAQIINLHIAGMSLADIGAQIGASADEVDRMIQSDAARYVRNQPSLRVYVRNYISGKYDELLKAVWDEATDKTHKEKLEHQDRALRILDRMAKLHGAEAPAQTEVKVESAPEQVERLVNVLAAAQGLGYDPTIFDVVDGEVVDEMREADSRALSAASEAVEEADEEGDGDGL